MKDTGKLTYFCGKMAAGKSTRSIELAAQTNAVLLSEDAWLAQLYPDQIKTIADYAHYAGLLKQPMKSHVINILETGTDVVMDFPANTVSQRQWFQSLIAESQCEHVLVYVQASDEQCLENLSRRRAEQPHRAAFDTEDVFRKMAGYFQPPSDDEGLTIQLIKP